jgi:sec-independent protein translocase protein TatA
MMAGMVNVLAIMGLGVPEMLLILVIVVLIFGAGRLPELGRGIGEGIRNFKKSIGGDEPGDDKKKV